MTEIDLALSARHNLWGGGCLSYRKAPIIAFKHVSPMYAEAFASGESIQVATYDYYTKGEGDRIDPLEGRSLNMSGEENIYFHAQCGNPGAIDMMNRLIGPGWQTQSQPMGMLVVGNILIQSLPPAYIFCASLAPDLSRFALGERIFMIHDLIEFAGQLMRYCPDLLKSARVAPVEYGKREFNILENGIGEAHPFRKAERFSSEDEVRIAFAPGTILEDPIRIRAPYVQNLITEIFGPFQDRGLAAYVTSDLVLK